MKDGALPLLLALLICGALVCFFGQQFATTHLISREFDTVRRQAVQAAMALRDEHPLASAVAPLAGAPPSAATFAHAAGTAAPVVVTAAQQWPPPPPLHASSLAAELARPFERLPRPPADAVGAASSACAQRKPYHVLLTAASGVYQEWQTRIAYYHYKKLKKMNPCSDVGGFTRLLNTRRAEPDGLMQEIPTILVRQLDYGRCDECDHGFIVMNRPWGLKQLM